MRWILQWFLEDLHGLFTPGAGDLRKLRTGMTRARLRKTYHQERLREAWERIRELSGRIAVLEMSEDTHVDELVSVRRSLLAFERDGEHHLHRLQETKEALSRMELDGKRIRDGDEAENRAFYNEFLDG